MGFQNIVPLIVLMLVFILIGVRKIGSLQLKIWQIMLGGAVLSLVAGSITPVQALKSINLDVILFLFGMFIIGEAMQQSGFLSQLAYNLFHKAKNVDVLVIFIIFAMGFLSAVLMNDTLAIIGTPLVLYFSRKYQVSPKLLLLALAFSVTVGSVLSPIGNPQNLLIALGGGIKNPFVVFIRYLFFPTLISLISIFLILKFFYKNEFHKINLEYKKEELIDGPMAYLCKISLIIVLSLIGLKILVVSLSIGADFPMTAIALIGAAPIILFSGKRAGIIKKIDWSTLVFFASMFILMRSVWDSGAFQSLLNAPFIDLHSRFLIMTLSVFISQLISNVPYVALVQPLMIAGGAQSQDLLVLASGSTIAGNLLILGAASNVIIIQNAEKEGETITFVEFARAGIPLTAINILVYWVFLK